MHAQENSRLYEFAPVHIGSLYSCVWPLLCSQDAAKLVLRPTRTVSVGRSRE